jgi:hypothetical protein
MSWRREHCLFGDGVGYAPSVRVSALASVGMRANNLVHDTSIRVGAGAIVRITWSALRALGYTRPPALALGAVCQLLVCRCDLLHFAPSDGQFHTFGKHAGLLSALAPEVRIVPLRHEFPQRPARPGNAGGIDRFRSSDTLRTGPVGTDSPASVRSGRWCIAPGLRFRACSASTPYPP